MKKAQLLTSALLVSGVFALTACGDKKPADQAGAKVKSKSCCKFTLSNPSQLTN